MGQAKNRGTQEQRQADAAARERSKFPKTIQCNHCKTELADIVPLDVKAIVGLRLAGAAVCHACQSVTWVIDGTAQAIGQVEAMLSSEHGGMPAQKGFAKKP